MTRENERSLTLPFESIRSIAAGSAEVRVWHDTVLDCDRVGKRVDLSLVGPDVVPEASTLQAIRHPNVLEIVGAAKVAGFDPLMDVVEIVTPYYPRGSVTDALLRGEVFLASEAIRIVQDALMGLSELHEVHGLCHRDVKSGNILLREGAGGAAIADIGVAGKLDHDGRVPAINNPTLYSPPEHSGGVLLGRDADLFGLGLVFRELIGGPFPYDAYTRSDVIARLARSRYPLRPPDMALPIWASRSLVRFYNKATARNPGNRFQSARDMSSTLAQVRVANWTNLNADQWRALSLRHPDVAVQVDLVAIRRGFRASIRKTTGRGWRRVLGDQDFDSRQSFASAGLFDQAAASL